MKQRQTPIVPYRSTERGVHCKTAQLDLHGLTRGALGVAKQFEALS
ncbi:MAG: hypothetical protein ACI9B9_002053, partial [Halioglobus sp.]